MAMRFIFLWGAYQRIGNDQTLISTFPYSNWLNWLNQIYLNISSVITPIHYRCHKTKKSKMVKGICLTKKQPIHNCCCLIKFSFSKNIDVCKHFWNNISTKRIFEQPINRAYEQISLTNMSLWSLWKQVPFENTQTKMET